VAAICLLLIFFAYIPLAHCEHTGINKKDEIPDIDLPFIGFTIPEVSIDLSIIGLGKVVLIPEIKIDLMAPFEWLINESGEAVFDLLIYYPMSGLKWIFDSITNILLGLGIASPLAVSLSITILTIVALVIIAVVLKVLDIVL